MKTIYYYDEPPESFSKSIFLAGPSPRTPDVKSWRPYALKILKANGYNGVVFIPEKKPGKNNTKYSPSLASPWEHKMLNMADIILFWVPRDLETLPGFTTNVEFGHWANSGKAVFGCPPKAPHTSYLKFMTDKFYVPTLFTLENTIYKALELLKDGALRTGGEREVPLFIWRLRAFQSWYRALRLAGNRLDGTKVEWISRVRNRPEAVFAFALRPNIHIGAENRNKINDPVVFRLDISSVVLYKKHCNPLDSEVIIIKEFRSASSTQDGFIWELPGGSSPYITDPLEVAVEETKEEVGLDIKSSRLKYIGSRQMAGTLSAHKSHSYAVKLTDNELAWLKSQKGVLHGTGLNDPTGEQAYTEVLTLREIIRLNLVDWSNLGMILSVIN